MNVSATTPAMLAMSADDTSAHNSERRPLAAAIAAIDQSGLWPGRTLKIHVDVTSQRMTVQVVNSETGDLVEQIPAEEALRIAEELGGGAGTAQTSK